MASPISSLADAVGSLPPDLPESCKSFLTRWMNDSCYCMLGNFYTASTPSSSSLASTAAVAARAAHEVLGQMDWYEYGLASPLCPTHRPWCATRGVEEWGTILDHSWYRVYAALAGLAFFLIGGWSAVRVCVARRAAQPLRQAQTAINGLCCLASFIRLGYVLSEAWLVLKADPHATATTNCFFQKVASASYSSFFPLSAAAFLCLCQHWLRGIYVMDDVEEDRWHRNRPYFLCAIFVALDFIHDILYVLVPFAPWLEAVYFMILAFVGCIVAHIGWLISRRLYKRLREWVQDDSYALFRRTLVSASAASVLSAAFLGLSIVQALWGRFWAWPCFLCWMAGRLLEVIYLIIILKSISRPALSSATTSAPPWQADVSFVSGVSDGLGSPSALEAFWISAPAATSIADRGRNRWPQAEEATSMHTFGPQNGLPGTQSS